MNSSNQISSANKKDFVMNLTDHAKQRMHQRSIPQIVVDLLLQFGHREPAGDGTWKYYFDKPSRRRFQKYAGPLSGVLEQYLNAFVVVGSDSTLVTAAHRCERIRRH